jgi:hypothetical protein
VLLSLCYRRAFLGSLTFIRDRGTLTNEQANSSSQTVAVHPRQRVFARSESEIEHDTRAKQ